MDRFVWLNLLTGEFSNSWTKDEMYSLTVEKLVKDCEGKEGWKLISFSCPNDPEFVFTRHMKLR